MASRLKIILSKLILEEHSGFVHVKNITYGIIIVHEALSFNIESGSKIYESQTRHMIR